VNLAEKLVMRPIGALVPYASNSRTHTPEQKISKIARKRDGLGFAIDPVYRIETSWPSVEQALTRRLTRCDPLSRTDFMSILQLPFRSSISTNTALPGSKTAEPSRSSCQFSAPSPLRRGPARCRR